MRFKSFLIITTAIAFSSVAFAQESKDVVKPDSVKQKLAIQPRASVIVGDRVDHVDMKDKMSSKQEIFYSNAPMYVAKKEGTPLDPVALFVVGTVKFDDAAEIVHTGQTSLTGDFVSIKGESTASTAVTPLFKPDVATGINPNADGVINFVGKLNKQKITREKLDGTAPLTNASKVSTTDANIVMHFPTIKVVKEGFADLTAASFPAKDANDVPIATEADKTNFLKNAGMLEISSNVAMSVAKLDLRGGNRFVVEALTDGMDVAGSGNTDRASYYKINSAYVDIRENLGVETTNTTTLATHQGYHELNLRLYNFDVNKDMPVLGADGKPVANPDLLFIQSNTYEVNKPKKAGSLAGAKINATFFRGFTSPFEKLHADYLFYHVLTKPEGQHINSLEGSGIDRRPVSNPRTDITPGRGFFYSMDASREFYDDISDRWHPKHNGTAWDVDGEGWLERERGGINFSRLMREWEYRGVKKRSNFTLYHETVTPLALAGDGTTSPAENQPKIERESQRFNTGNVEVDINLNGKKEDLFYLANPFMTPINLKSLLRPMDATGTIEEGTLPVDADDPIGKIVYPVSGLNAYAVHYLDRNVNVIPAGQVLLRSRYWVVNTGLLAYDPTVDISRYFYNVKYDMADIATGATSVPSEIGERYIEPMQMFVVQAATSGKITFRNSLKTFKGKPFEVKFNTQAEIETRSAKASTTENEPLVIPDWFVIQASVKDADIAADRTAVRFFNTASVDFDPMHDVEKIIENSSTLAKEDHQEYSDYISPTNVIYTTAASVRKEALLSNAVDYSVKEIPLHYLSGNKENQDVTLSFFGMEGFDKVPKGRLVDNYLGVERELVEGLEYQFVSNPTEAETTAPNRFTLKFYDDEGTGPVLTENPITCYYSGSTLHIGGLNEKDLGSKVYIYDLQGRLMGSTVINNYPGMEYRKSLGLGTFIVKIVGARNYGTKFVNLQNY